MENRNPRGDEHYIVEGRQQQQQNRSHQLLSVTREVVRSRCYTNHIELNGCWFCWAGNEGAVCVCHRAPAVIM